MTALAFRVGRVELIAGQFQSQGQKISQRRIHLQNLPGFSWLVKNRADLAGSAQNTQILEQFFAAAEQFLHQLIGNWTTPAMLPVFLRPLSNALMWRAKETINDHQWLLSDGFHC